MTINKLLEVDGIGPATVKKLNKANIFTIDELVGHTPEELSKIKGIGLKSAGKWISSAKQLIGEASEAPKRPQIVLKEPFRPSEPALKETQSDLKTIYSTLGSIEQRLDQIERKSKDKSIKSKDIATSRSEKPYIRNERFLYDLIKEKINEMTKGRLGIKKGSIEDLYKKIIKDYSITKEIFGEFLLMLYNDKKIQLEPGYMDDGFSIRDNYGNFFKVIRLLD